MAEVVAVAALDTLQPPPETVASPQTPFFSPCDASLASTQQNPWCMLCYLVCNVPPGEVFSTSIIKEGMQGYGDGKDSDASFNKVYFHVELMEEVMLH